jgi:outer membrane receptor protein involved in Fe transport
MSALIKSCPKGQRHIYIPVLLATTILAGAPFALAQEAQPVAGLEEIIVTAQKRAENLQTVPISIQVLGADSLKELHVSDFNDYVKYLPSVTFQTSGPSQAKIYMRGVASGENANHSGPLPSVGIYLDEQPVTTIQGALDVHVYDIARVEALAGPQGTLYGASSEAGTIRIITNKPEIGKFKAGYDIGVNQVAHGGVGYTGEGFINAPISDKAAIRLVGWYQHDAGYIDNVHGARTYPSSGKADDNAALAKDNYNDATTWGGRAALKINLDDNWTVTPSIMGQDQKSNGLSAFDPHVGDLKVIHFNPESNHDRWFQAALTVEGKIGNFDVVYAGAYMKRNIDSQSDYSDYSFFYDTLAGYGVYWYDNNGDLINPSQYIVGKDRFTKMSHELRLSSPKDNRLRFVGGLFMQRQTHGIEQDYKINGLATSISVPGWPDTIWLTEQKRIDRDYAAFGELSFDLTDKLTATGGLRAFKADNSLVGFFGYGAGYSSHTGEAACFGPAVVAGSPCTNLDKRTKENGVIHRLNLTYKIDDKAMIYATWSRGFRPGGINRRGTLPPYHSDYLTNYELGWKSSWADNRLRFNGALFWEEWKNIQLSFLGQNGLTEIVNAGNARIKGIEASLTAQPTTAFTLTGAATYIDAKTKNDFCKYANPQFDCTLLGPSGETDNEVLAPAGTELPVTPKFKANMTARYEFLVHDLNAHLQGSVVYQGASWVQLKLLERGILGKMEPYAVFDFTAGVQKDNWSVEAFVQNAFDKRGSTTRSVECLETVCGGQVYTVPNRPRLIGIKFGQNF